MPWRSPFVFRAVWTLSGRPSPSTTMMSPTPRAISFTRHMVNGSLLRFHGLQRLCHPQGCSPNRDGGAAPSRDSVLPSRPRRSQLPDIGDRGMRAGLGRRLGPGQRLLNGARFTCSRSSGCSAHWRVLIRRGRRVTGSYAKLPAPPTLRARQGVWILWASGPGHTIGQWGFCLKRFGYFA